MLLQTAGTVEVEEGKIPHPTFPLEGATQGDHKGKERTRGREGGKEEAGCFLQHSLHLHVLPLPHAADPTNLLSMVLYEAL